MGWKITPVALATAIKSLHRPSDNVALVELDLLYPERPSQAQKEERKGQAERWVEAKKFIKGRPKSSQQPSRRRLFSGGVLREGGIDILCEGAGQRGKEAGVWSSDKD